MSRLIHALLVGLFGAGIVHITILFLLPIYTEKDAWTQLARISEPFETVRLGASNEPPLPVAINPLFRAVACRFDLESGPMHVHAEGDVPFWSMSVYDQNGLNIFSFNDRTANEGTLDFVVLSPERMIEMRNAVPAEFEQSIFVEADIAEGIVLVRVFRPDDTWQDVVSSFLDSITCQPR